MTELANEQVRRGRPGQTSPLFDLSTIDTRRWVTTPEDCIEVDRMLHDTGHYPLLSDTQIARLRQHESLEVHAGRLRQFEPPTDQRQAGLGFDSGVEASAPQSRTAQ